MVFFLGQIKKESMTHKLRHISCNFLLHGQVIIFFFFFIRAVFNYNKYHNVMQVSSQEYYSCTVASPIATLNTGKDSFTLSAPGDYYYICGIPGHCQIGQKVHIQVSGSQAKNVQGNAYLSKASVVSSHSFLWFSIVGMLGICFF